MSTHDRNRRTAQVRAWLVFVMRHTGLKQTPLAREAGISPSTLSRALDTDDPTELDRRSILRIVERFGVPEPGKEIRLMGFSDDEVTRLDSQPPVFAGEALTPNQYVARVVSRAVDLAGVLPGDELLFDMAASPRADDVVAAQVYAIGAAEAATVLRIFDPPFIVTRSTDARGHATPVLVDGQRARIAAVMVKAFRQRQAD